MPGGANGQESIRKGIYDIASRHQKEDLILIHDAIRPLVSEEIQKLLGNILMHPLSGSSCNNQCNIFHTACSFPSPGLGIRYNRLEYLEHVHQEAIEKNVLHCVDNNSMLARLGETIHFSPKDE